MRISPLLLIPALALANTSIDRLQTSHLAAVHAQRLEWLKKRADLPTLGVYNDYRAVLNVSSGAGHVDGDKSKHARAEILDAAKADGVSVVMFSNPGAASNAPAGLRDGVLFLAGIKDGNSRAMEIYNRQTDATLHQELYDYLQKSMKRPVERRRLSADFKAYPDEFYAAGTDVLPRLLSQWDEESFLRPVTGFAASDAPEDQILKGVSFDPYAVAFRFVSTHILARDLTEPEIRASLAAGRAYIAFDWLCDPAGFTFTADNGLGVYDIGDGPEMLANTRLTVRLPIPAKIKLIHGNAIVAEANDSKLSFTVKEIGGYRVEAWLTVDGEDRPWIFSNPIFVRAHGAVSMPPPPIPGPAAINIAKNVSYIDGDPADAMDHQLDLYLPKNQTNFPVMVFYSGWSWQSDDRAAYAGLGDRFARAGIGVAISSHRPIAHTAYPAQIDDAAAAFAWVYKNIASYGGDPSRIYIAGHSAGAHLAALLALDPQFLKRFDIPPSAIHGVASLSGIYDVSHTGMFGDFGLDASPDRHIHSGAPPFLITYCQWDYLGFPKQARDFAAALKSKFVSAKLVYIPGKNHFSEIFDLPDYNDATAAALLDFIK